MNTSRKPVAVVIGATSKWQSDGRNTHLVHGGDIDDSDLPVGVRWGVGGAISLKFAHEGFYTVLTTRSPNAAPLGGSRKRATSADRRLDLFPPGPHFRCLWPDRVELADGRPGLQRRVTSKDATVPPEWVAGGHHTSTRDAQHISSVGPFGRQGVLPSMREREGSS